MTARIPLPIEPPTAPLYDVIIIGAGPCGLATAARLREQHPSALFTDGEQARYSWISRHSAVKTKRSRKAEQANKQEPGKCSSISVLILDDHGDGFMHRWNSLFAKLHISYLRSPMFFHPDPRERDALLAYCHDLPARGEDAQEISGCVGKELSKHRRKKGAVASRDINERERVDYFAPSVRAFRGFCAECVQRYELGGLVRKGRVEGVELGLLDGSSGIEKVFTIRTGAGEVYRSRAAVLAIGGGDPVVPGFLSGHSLGSMSHALDTGHSTLLPEAVEQHLASGLPTCIAVVGGGLTAAQAADCLLSHGVSHIHLFMRGPWKVKPFDVDLAWMGKWKNHSKAEFWSERDSEARLQMAKDARGGGSITPRFTKCLKEWVRKGRLTVHTCTSIAEAEWDTDAEAWDLRISPDSSIPLPSFHHIICATGLGSDINTLPMLSSMRTQHPVSSFGGFPVLTSDLKWTEDVPLFVTGKLAMLQLGPGAGNLEGARLGAERIAWGVEKVLDKSATDGEYEDDSDDGVENYVKGVGSKYEGLMGEDSGVDF